MFAKTFRFLRLPKSSRSTFLSASKIVTSHGGVAVGDDVGGDVGTIVVDGGDVGTTVADGKVVVDGGDVGTTVADGGDVGTIVVDDKESSESATGS